MTLHPIVVHFPVALCTLYALLELAGRLKFLNARPWFFYVKAVFAIIGAGGTVAAYLTGRLQFVTLDEVDVMTRTHAQWAWYTMWLFAFIGLMYLVLLVGKEFPTWLQKNALLARVYGWSNALTSSWFMPAIALVGLMCITVTGALGGATVYGRDVDPAVKIITDLLVPEQSSQ